VFSTKLGRVLTGVEQLAMLGFRRDLGTTNVSNQAISSIAGVREM
jgi:hypothetical protein